MTRQDYRIFRMFKILKMIKAEQCRYAILYRVE